MVLYERPGRDIDRRLVGFWPLNDKRVSTTTAIDQVNFNDGVITGCVNTAGINGLSPDAMLFDGVNDFISIPLLPVFDNISTNDFSIAFWVKPKNVTGGATFVRLFEARKDNDNFVQFVNSSPGVFGTVIEDSTTQRTISGGGVLIDSWCHFVLTWNASSNEVNFYIDAVAQSGASEGNSSPGATEIINIGRRSDGDADTYFNGLFSRFRIYDRIITKGEISKLYRLRL